MFNFFILLHLKNRWVNNGKIIDCAKNLKLFGILKVSISKTNIAKRPQGCYNSIYCFESIHSIDLERIKVHWLCWRHVSEEWHILHCSCVLLWLGEFFLLQYQSITCLGMPQVLQLSYYFCWIMYNNSLLFNLYLQRLETALGAGTLLGRTPSQWQGMQLCLSFWWQLLRLIMITERNRN